MRAASAVQQRKRAAAGGRGRCGGGERGEHRAQHLEVPARLGAEVGARMAAVRLRGGGVEGEGVEVLDEGAGLGEPFGDTGLDQRAARVCRNRSASLWVSSGFL
jgi:hypothetical protein